VSSASCCARRECAPDRRRGIAGIVVPDLARSGHRHRHRRGIAVWLHFEGFTFPGMKELYAQYGLPGVIHPKLSFASFMLGPAVILVFTMLARSIRVAHSQLQPVEAIHAV